MKTFLECYQDHLCVVTEEPDQDGTESGVRRIWYPVRRATPEERHIRNRLPVRQIDVREGIYIDEDGNVYQLANKGETKPIEEQSCIIEKSQLEVLLEASLDGKAENVRNVEPKQSFRNKRVGSRRQKDSKIVTASRGSSTSSSLLKNEFTLNSWWWFYG
jgi:hypothetical protein